jgi:hypothetical protein
MDEVLLDESRVLVTRRKVQIGGVSYSANQIASLRSFQRAPSTAGPLLLLVLGLGALMAAFVAGVLVAGGLTQGTGFDTRSFGVCLVAGGLGVGLLLMAINLLRQGGGHLVVLSVSSGERGVFVTQDKAQAARVREAIEAVIGEQ